MREARGWSLDALAQHIGTTNQQISLLEGGKRRLTVDWLMRLGSSLACHPWELVAPGLPQPPDVEEIQLLEGYRCLVEEQRSAVLTLVNAMSSPRRRHLASKKKRA